MIGSWNDPEKVTGEPKRISNKGCLHPAVPGVSPHFWGPTTSSYAKISIIYNKGAQCTYKDVVWHAWGEIYDLYFPKVAATPTGPRWAIDREAYRAGPRSLSA
jgi:hypothetical protein